MWKKYLFLSIGTLKARAILNSKSLRWSMILILRSIFTLHLFKTRLLLVGIKFKISSWVSRCFPGFNSDPAYRRENKTRQRRWIWIPCLHLKSSPPVLQAVEEAFEDKELDALDGSFSSEDKLSLSHKSLGLTPQMIWFLYTLLIGGWIKKLCFTSAPCSVPAVPATIPWCLCYSTSACSV